MEIGASCDLGRNISDLDINPKSERERTSYRVLSWLKSNCQLNLNSSVLLSDLYNDYESFCRDKGILYSTKKMFSCLMIENLQEELIKGLVVKSGTGKVTIKGLEIKSKLY